MSTALIEHTTAIVTMANTLALRGIPSPAR